MKKGALGQLLSPFGITQLVMIAAVGAALWLAYSPWRWGKVSDALREEYPESPRIDNETLANWVADPDNIKPFIFDIRTKAEFETSRIAGARNSGASEIPGALGENAPADTPIIVYCPVGLDSAAVVSGLQRRGYKHVQYLEGGIFRWANEGHPLVNSAGPTTLVKAGSSPYSDLLDRRHRAR